MISIGQALGLVLNTQTEKHNNFFNFILEAGAYWVAQAGQKSPFSCLLLSAGITDKLPIAASKTLDKKLSTKLLPGFLEAPRLFPSGLSQPL